MAKTQLAGRKRNAFPAIKMSREEAKGFVSAYNKHAGNATLAGAEFGLTRDQMRRRLSQAGIQHKLFPKNFSVLETAQGKVASPEVAATVKLVRANTDNAYMRSQIKQLNIDIDKLHREIAKYQFATNAGITPAEWTLKDHSKRGKSPHIPVLFTSDAQVGEVVDAAEVEYGRGYSTPIYRERHRELIDTTIYLADKHTGDDWTFPGIIYIRGGDAVSGGIHEELRETDDSLPLEAARVVFEEESAGIRKLVEYFGKVDVKSVSGGNHDRDTPKRQTKKRVGHSIDALVDYMLADHFKDDKRVTFQLTKSTDVIFPIFDKQALATHGDNIGSGGGTGYVGPIASITKGVQKIMMEQTNMGRIIDHVYVGHFHQFHHSRIVTANGSYVGYSEFAKSFRMRPEPPTQTLQFWNAKRGLVDLRPIVLT